MKYIVIVILTFIFYKYYYRLFTSFLVPPGGIMESYNTLSFRGRLGWGYLYKS